MNPMFLVLGVAVGAYVLAKTETPQVKIPAAVLDKRTQRQINKEEQNAAVAAVGSIWHSQEVRDANKRARHTRDLLDRHRDIERRIRKLSQDEADLASDGIDVDTFNETYDLIDWQSVLDGR